MPWEGRFIYYEWDGERAVPVPYPPPIEDPGYFETHMRVAKTSLTTPFGDVEVSTVFLPIDHAFGDGPPVLWETHVFGGLWDGYEWRYISRADADAGHARVVEAIRMGRSLDDDRDNL